MEMNKDNIAQWVIDNRYPKSEFNKISDMEMYHEIVGMIDKLINKNSVIPDVSEILEFAKREKRMAEGSSEECIQECDNEEQSLIYTGQAQAYEELITWLSSR